MTDKQPEALRLADALRGHRPPDEGRYEVAQKAAAELRRLQEENARLRFAAEHALKFCVELGENRWGNRVGVEHALRVALGEKK